MQANTVPATFWTLAYLLQPEHAHHLAEVKHLIAEPIADPGSQPLKPAADQHPGKRPARQEKGTV